jgi:hypothetical protein
MKRFFITSILFFAFITIYAQQNSSDTKKKPNPLTLKYPQGITEEITKTDKYTTITRIVVKGDDAWVYRKRVFDFGQVRFYKDDVAITMNEWETETKPTTK